jgi:hypothetical protein
MKVVKGLLVSACMLLLPAICTLSHLDRAARDRCSRLRVIVTKREQAEGDGFGADYAGGFFATGLLAGGSEP